MKEGEAYRAFYPVFGPSRKLFFFIVRKFANRFLDKGVEVETRLPYIVWETLFMWRRVYFFPDFFGLFRVNITGFGMSRVLEIA